ncbi:hypothetical protein [Streptomyces sp. bgisy027]|uniref:hypothetical protein n=1 Tax=Streptomyces sp. bgisy027 TaxID=3413770 RepID=UPI003D749A08
MTQRVERAARLRRLARHGADLKQLPSSSFIDYGWSTDRNDGGGTYTYYPGKQGYASGIGWGPKTRSDNELRKGCGTRSPNP